MRIDETYAYLCVHDTAAAIHFYGKAFGATEKFRLVEPSGRIGHAELAFGSHTVMLCDEFPECGIRSARSLGATPVTLHLHVDDADALLTRAVDRGARLTRPPQDQFYGERSGAIVDPFGHSWSIGHDIETVQPAEMQRRWNTMVGG